MASGQKWFEILLDKPDHKFSPGETIAGRIVLNLSRPKKIKNIAVRIKGMAKVNWSESSGTGKTQTTTYYSGEELYFRLDAYVLGKPDRHIIDGDSIELNVGSHVFEFAFALPRHIPSSFETMYGGIRYTLKGILQQTRKFDQVTALPFTVVTPYDITHPQFQMAMNPMVIEETETFCSLGFKNGGLIFYVRLPISAFSIGEFIRAEIYINSKVMSSRVTKVKLDLEQRIELHALSPRKTRILTKVIQTVKEKRRHLAASRKYPIVIGTKPSNQWLENPNNIYSTMPTTSSCIVEVPMSVQTEPMPRPQSHDQQFSSKTRNEFNVLPLDVAASIPNPAQTNTSMRSMEKPSAPYINENELDAV